MPLKMEGLFFHWDSLELTSYHISFYTTGISYPLYRYIPFRNTMCVCVCEGLLPQSLHLENIGEKGA